MNFKSEKTEAITLDQFVERHGLHPDVLHVDVQRAEVKFMRGLTSRNPKLVFLEVADHDCYKAGRRSKIFWISGFNERIWCSASCARSTVSSS